MPIQRPLLLPALATLCLLLLGCTQGGLRAGDAPPPDPGTRPEITRGPTADKTLTLFVGAASKPAMEAVVDRYREKTGMRVDVSYGGSGALLTQFSTEQFGDVYVPGSDDFMGLAQERGAVIPETRRIMAYLVPMILVQKGNPLNIQTLGDLARADVRLVLAQPKTVCLGDVSEEILEDAGLLERVRANVASYAASCEDTLNMLLLGEADAIIAWDAYPRQHPEKIDGVDLPAHLVRVRNIPAAVITWSDQREQAERFIEFLTSEEGKQIVSRHEYTVEWTGEG